MWRLRLPVHADQCSVASTPTNAGSIGSGLLATVLSHPLDIIKTNMQGNLTSPSWRTMSKAASTLYRTHGEFFLLLNDTLFVDIYTIWKHDGLNMPCYLSFFLAYSASCMRPAAKKSRKNTLNTRGCSFGVPPNTRGGHTVDSNV